MAVIEVTRPAFWVQIASTQPLALSIQRNNRWGTFGSEVRL